MGNENTDDIDDIEQQAMMAAQERYEEGLEQAFEYDDLIDFIERVLVDLKRRRALIDRDLYINERFLATVSERTEIGLIYDTIKRAHEPAVAVNISTDDLIKFIAPNHSGHKRVTGEALLRVIARGIVEVGAPMDFTQMIDFLDRSGYERPGANYRNNLISMVTKAPHIFKRVGRGVYDVTDEEREQILGETAEEDAS